MKLPFDAHNHIHLGPSPPSSALWKEPGRTGPPDEGSLALSGMAIMSTHPQDFEAITTLSTSLSELQPGVRIVPCYGVHPWFLHELEDRHWEEPDGSTVPSWVAEIELLVMGNPEATVGEIGLDGFHFRPDTGELSSSMEKQVEAFELQMNLAARLRRPVSVHTVQCFGHLMESLSRIKKLKYGHLQEYISTHLEGNSVPSTSFWPFAAKAKAELSTFTLDLHLFVISVLPKRQKSFVRWVLRGLF